jgi:hypothetical protein
MSLLAQALSEYSRSCVSDNHKTNYLLNSLREHSHGKDMTYITNTAIEVINFVKSKGIEVRFSSEDSFRSGKAFITLIAAYLYRQPDILVSSVGLRWYCVYILESRLTDIHRSC